MAVVTTFDTLDAGSNGAISRDKNTRRVFVSPANFAQAAVTGTWALAEEITSVMSLQTDDAGTTNVFNIPFPVQYSDFNQRGSTVDRGVQIVGLEVMYQVATSNIAAVALAIVNVAFAAIGTPAATTLTTTTTFDTGDATGLTQVHHRIKAYVATRDRVYIDSGSVPYGRFSVTDGTSSDVNIHGAIWHLRVVEE